LDALGLTPLHRRTFSKVRDKIEAEMPLPLEMPMPSLSSHTAIS
jgi:hypothetical protein